VHESQGVEDDGDGGLEIAYQRLLGYPNETTGSMPSECARALDEWAVRPNQWRLLAQLSGRTGGRLYIWIRDPDLSRSI
jgi:hypothetical protein